MIETILIYDIDISKHCASGLKMTDNTTNKSNTTDPKVKLPNQNTWAFHPHHSSINTACIQLRQSGGKLQLNRRWLGRTQAILAKQNRFKYCWVFPIETVIITAIIIMMKVLTFNCCKGLWVNTPLHESCNHTQITLAFFISMLRTGEATVCLWDELQLNSLIFI